jgi:hypothetical protein
MSSIGDAKGAAQLRSIAEPDLDLKHKLLAAYKRMLAYQFCGAIIMVALPAAVLVFSYVTAKGNVWQPPILMVVALAGIVGAFFSALTRLHRVDRLPLALMSDTVLGLNGLQLVVYSIVPPVVGAIAAMVVYLAFISGIFDSGVFPKLVCKSATKTCNDLVQVLNDYGPEKAADYGKALVWSFFAGFAERLVPDMLQAVLARMQSESGK